MKKLLLIVIGLLVGAVGIAAIVGALLPKDHVAAMSVVINAPQIQVWTTITDPSTYTTWRKGLKSVTVISSSPLSWKETNSMGDMTLEVDVFQAPSRMVATIADEGAPFGGEWEYQLAPESDPGKTKVTIIERGWVKNVVFRFASKFIMGHETGINDYLRALSKKFGTEGTPVTVTIKDSSSA